MLRETWGIFVMDIKYYIILAFLRHLKLSYECCRYHLSIIYMHI